MVAAYCTLPLHAYCFWHHKRRNLTTKNLHQHQTACHPGKISYSVYQKKKRMMKTSPRLKLTSLIVMCKKQKLLLVMEDKMLKLGETVCQNVARETSVK